MTDNGRTSRSQEDPHLLRKHPNHISSMAHDDKIVLYEYDLEVDTNLCYVLSRLILSWSRMFQLHVIYSYYKQYLWLRMISSF